VLVFIHTLLCATEMADGTSFQMLSARRAIVEGRAGRHAAGLAMQMVPAQAGVAGMLRTSLESAGRRHAGVFRQNAEAGAACNHRVPSTDRML